MLIGKKVKMKIGKEMDLVDSKEEVKGCRRRFGKLAKMKAKRRLRNIVLHEEDESDFDDMAPPKKSMKQKMMR